MKLLIFIHSLSTGGAERVTANLANYWAEKSWEITIVTLTGKESDFYAIHPSIKRIALGLDAKSSHPVAAIRHNYQRIKALRKVLRNEQPDVALAMMTTANILLALAARGSNLPAVGPERVHPPMFPLGRVWEWLRRHTYQYLSAVTALTRESGFWIKNNTTARYVPIIPNAVTYPLPVTSPQLQPTILNEHQYNLIAMGRLAPQKGFDLLLSAFAEIAPRFPDWHLTILGEGEEREALEQQCLREGIRNKVSFPGVVGNPGEWYEAADLFVMTSLFEGFPNALAEAMAHGLAAISVDCDTGPRDIIRHEIDGLLVPQNNHNALVEALVRLMSDSALREQFASRAVEARERFSMDKIAGMWEKLFTEIIKKECV